MLALTMVLCVSFASGVFAVVSDLSDAQALAIGGTDAQVVVTEGTDAQIVATGSTIIPRPPEFLAPSVSHSVYPLPGADMTLPFPYQLNLVGFNTEQAQVTSFNLFIVDSNTREVVTAQEHIGPLLAGGSAVLSSCGDFIEIDPVPAIAAGRVEGQIVVNLQHGQEVVITTAVLPGYMPHWSGSNAIGLETFSALSFFWDNGSPAGFPTSPPPGFTAAHKEYSFQLNNPNLPSNPLAIAPYTPNAPPHFHGGPVDPSYGEGFILFPQGWLLGHILNSEVRIEAVWTFEGELPTHSVETTVPITKHLEISAETTAPAIIFTFEFDRLSFTDAAGETSATANMPPIPNREITIPATVTGSAGAAVSESLENALAGISFDRPGIFVYRVSEAQTASAVPPLSAGMNLEFSPAEYDLRIEVREDNDELFVYSVTITVVEVDEHNSSAPEEGTEFDVPPGVLVFTNVLTYTPIVVPPLSVETTASLTKYLEISTDTTFTVPSPLLFEFNFEKVSFNSSSDAATLAANMPTVPSPQPLNFVPTVSEVATATVMDDAISNVLEGVSFETTGTFVYRVTEVPNTTNINASPPIYKMMTYSQEVYHLIVTVVDNSGVLEASVRIAVVENGVEGDDVDGLAFTNVLTYSPDDPPPPCDECGERPCVCPPPPPPTCPECGEYPCVCPPPPPPPCDVCGEDPCVCDTGGQETPCPECGNYPCTCPPPPPETCDVCGEDPCVCVTGPQEEGEEETPPTTPTPPRGEGRDPAPAGPKTGDWSNPSLHLLHMFAAMVLMVVVAYRLACSSEAVVRRKS